MKEENKSLEESQKIYEELFRAYLFAYPLVETVVYSREKTNTIKANAEKAPRNQFAHNANIWRPEENKPGGPNMDTVYSLTSLQLEDGAIIFHKPETDRFYTFLILDAYGTFVSIIGSGGKGGRSAGDYVLTGPDFKGTIPEHTERISIPTNLATGLLRIQIRGEEELEYVRALQRQSTLKPVSYYGREYPLPDGIYREEFDYNHYSKMKSIDIEEFFAIYNKAVEENPTLPGDQAEAEKYTKYHIGKGLHFSLSDLRDEALIEKIRKLPSSILWTEEVKKRQTVRNNWGFSSFEITKPGSDYFIRAYSTHWGPGCNPAEASVYPSTSVDRDGKPLTGKCRYQIHFEKSELPPVKEDGYWSLSLYTKEDMYLIKNEIDRYKVGSESELDYNEDGSLDIYLQHERPEESHYKNWLPAGEGEFMLILRVYIPKEEVLDGRWQPPAITNVTENG